MLLVISGGGSMGVTGGRVGRSALRPLPSTLRALSGLFTVQNLLCQLNVTFRTRGAGVVGQNRLAKARRLSQAYAPRNDGVEYLLFEKIAQVGGNLPGQIGAVVEHRQKNALDSQRVLKGFADPFNGINEFRNAFQGEEFALYRHKHGIGGN